MQVDAVEEAPEETDEDVDIEESAIETSNNFVTDRIQLSQEDCNDA